MAINRAEKLKAIEELVENSTSLPLYEYRIKHGYRAVTGQGDPNARIMFIGEAPGKQEALSGKPFAGAAGRVLDDLLASVGLERQQIYITNILKDRPPENRQPQTEEIEQYAPFLRQQIEIIQPELIVTLGRYAMQFILAELDMPEQGGTISELHGRALQARAAYGPITVLPLFHPAVALYRRDQKVILEEDFKVLKVYTASDGNLQTSKKG